VYTKSFTQSYTPKCEFCEPLHPTVSFGMNDSTMIQFSEVPPFHKICEEK